MVAPGAISIHDFIYLLLMTTQMLSRWRIKVKVWDRNPCKRLSERRKPVYKCVKWFDSEPTRGEDYALLQEVMSKPAYADEHFYGEVTKEHVLHTSRSVFVPA